MTLKVDGKGTTRSTGLLVAPVELGKIKEHKVRPNDLNSDQYCLCFRGEKSVAFWHFKLQTNLGVCRQKLTVANF